MSFVYREPGKVVRDILVHELELEDLQVLFTNQKFQIPTVGLFMVVSYVGPSKVIANVNELAVNDSGDMVELQSATFLHLIQIDIMAFNDPSGGNQARERKEEIAMALRSIYAQQQQEAYAMQVARNPGPLMDTSFLEETEMLTRYTTTIMTSSSNQKEKSNPDYFTTFKAQINTDPATFGQPIEADPQAAHP